MYIHRYSKALQKDTPPLFMGNAESDRRSYTYKLPQLIQLRLHSGPLSSKPYPIWLKLISKP